ncbi:hypothetical protein ACO0SA_000177 [Hanseniaspora valbyensis]
MMSNNNVQLLQQQILQAISIAENPMNTDLELKKQAVNFLSSVKKDTDPSLLLQVYLSIYKLDETNNIYKFLSIQGLSDLIIISKEKNDLQSLAILKNESITLIADPSLANEPEFILNKFSELLANLFYTMYSAKNNDLWDSFFKDLITIFNIDSVLMNKNGFYRLSIFLKVTLQINTMIGEQMYNNNESKQIQDFHNNLKDSMRVNDVELLTNLWSQILAKVDNNDEIIKLTLSNIGSYVSWIDINLIINETCLQLIFNNFKSNTVVACCGCISEIISKKMPAENKVSLLEMLKLTEKLNNLIQVAITEENTEILLSLANLINGIGLEYCIMLENNSTDVNIVSQVDNLIIKNVISIILIFLKLEFKDDNAVSLEINMKVFTFLSNYFSFLKKSFAIGGKPGSPVNLQSKKLPIDEQHLNIMREIMNILQFKMVLNDDFEDYSTIDLQDLHEYNDSYREKLKNFQDSICIINPQVYLQQMVTYLQIDLRMDENWRFKEFYLYQLNNFAESVRNNLIGVAKNELFTNETTKILNKLLKNILVNNKSLITDNNNFLIIPPFFEIIGRHQNFLLIKESPTESSDELILLILNNFLSDFGIFNNNLKIKLTTWSSFNKFVKTCRPKLNMNQLVEIINKMKDILSISIDEVANPQLSAVVETTDNYLIKSISDADELFENQLFLFESIGFLMGSCSDLNYDILDYVLSPIFRQLEFTISTEVKTVGCLIKTHHMLFAIGNLIRGIHSGILPDNSYLHNLEFNGEKIVTNSVLIEVFSNIAEVVLVTLQFFSKYQLIRESVRFVFARLLILLNVNLGTYVDRLLTIFYSIDNMDNKEVIEFLTFVGQFFYILSNRPESFDILNKILTPLFQKVFEKLEELDKEVSLSTCVIEKTDINDENKSGSLSKTPSPELMNSRTDSYRDKLALKKALYSFIQGLTTNHIASLLTTNENSNTLSILINDLIDNIDCNMVNSEPVLMRMQMNVLINFIKNFGMGQASDTQDIHVNRVTKLEGLHEFLISKSVSLCFEVPFKPEYELNITKGPGRNVAIDLSRVLKAFYITNDAYCKKNGITNNDFISFLNESYFPSIQIPQNISNDFISNLINLNDKQFEKYWMDFIGKMK